MNTYGPLVIVLAVCGFQVLAFTLPSTHYSRSNLRTTDLQIRYLFNGGNGGNGGDSRRDLTTIPIIDVDDDSGSTDNSIQVSQKGGIAGGLQIQNQQALSLQSNKILDELEYGGRNALPIIFEFKEKGTNTYSTKKRTIQVRQMELQDLQKCVSITLKEYGQYSKIQSGQSETMKKIQSILDYLDNFVFSFVVLLGLEQRVTRRMKSDAIPSLPQDHNVVIISELIPNENGDTDEVIFGMAEISLQPPDPSRTAPPFVIPTQLKSFFAEFISATKGNKKPLCAYVSNVLITNEYRSKGYSKVLMAACHGLARNWGYTSTYLHVDADAKTGRAAQQLYRKLGYKLFIDKTYNEQFSWMGIESVNRGLYIVDGVPLLFLKKDL